MTKIWLVIDNGSCQVLEAFTTKKAAMEKARETYSTGRFHRINHSIYQYFISDDKHNPVCYIEKVPVRKVKRKK